MTKFATNSGAGILTAPSNVDNGYGAKLQLDNAIGLRKRRHANANRKRKNVDPKRTESRGTDASMDETKAQLKRQNESKDPEVVKRKKLNEMTTKERRLARRSKKPNYELTLECKRFWEKLRCRKCPERSRIELSNKIYDSIKGRLPQLMRTHDHSRIIQWLFLLGSSLLSVAVFEELKPHLLEMMTSKFGRKIVLKFLRHGTKDQKEEVVKSMVGNYKSLLINALSADLVEIAFTDYLKSKGKLSLLAELYGPVVKSMKEADRCVTFDEMIIKYPDCKEAILECLKRLLERIVEKPSVKFYLTHHLLKTYLTNCKAGNRSDMIQLLRDHVIEILHTPAGSYVSVMCILYGNNKDRKIIVKLLKTYILKICVDSCGFKVILAIFTAVDDTILVKKIVIPEIIKDLPVIASDAFGRQVLSYLFAQNQSPLIDPNLKQMLCAEKQNATSKKDKDVRHKELLDAIVPSVVEYLQIHIDKLLKDLTFLPTLKSLIPYCSGDMSAIYTKIVAHLHNRVTNSKGEVVYASEENGFDALVSCLMQLDKMKYEADIQSDTFFTRHLAETLTAENTGHLLSSNRGCFLLVRMLESKIPGVAKLAQDAVGPFLQKVKKVHTAGSQILLKLILST